MDGWMDMCTVVVRAIDISYGSRDTMSLSEAIAG